MTYYSLRREVIGANAVSRLTWDGPRCSVSRRRFLRMWAGAAQQAVLCG